MDEINQIVTDIKNHVLKPLYFLMGEESYYIDKISNFIEENVLDDNEKSFNQMVLYGRDVSLQDIIENAKRFPMMSKYQVIIIKEAQDLSRHIDRLLDYVKQPQPTTILVFNYKYKTLDKRKALYKALIKNGVVFESKKLYDNQIPDWINRVLMADSYTITPKAAQMLAEFLGTDLSKINNALNKLKIILPINTQITPDHIEKNIGISKDYNNFELHKAIGSKNTLKVYKIIKYFSENPKDNPIIVTIALLHNYFTKLLQVHGLQDRSPRNVASTLRINPYFAEEYLVATRNYPMKKISSIITELREIDLKSKGVNANALPQSDLLKELMVKIIP